MLFRETDFPLDAAFSEPAFENIFLHNAYPGEKRGAARGSRAQASLSDKAEIWALFDAQPHYNGLNLIRRLRQLWGIHLTIQIGARSASNSSPRGLCRISRGKKQPQLVYFEGYKGNISDATRSIVTIAPYDHGEKSRGLSQKFFIRLIVPLKGLNPLEKIESILLAYSIAGLMDPKRFAGVVDPDVFLFVPPESVRAGLAHFHRSDRLLNTHLVSGFNFYENEGRARFFTHGLNRFDMPDLILMETDRNKPLTTEHYAIALKKAHAQFLSFLTGAGNNTRLLGKHLPKSEKIPEQVAAMIGRKIGALTVS